MGIETGAAMLISFLIGAGSQQVAANKQRAAQKRIAKEKLRQTAEMDRKQRLASAQEVESERTAARAADRLTAAKGQQISNTALSQKGIKARPVQSFSDISKAVLDESDVG